MHSVKREGMSLNLVGIGLDSNAAKVASTRLDHVLCGNLEALQLEASWFAEESFDYVICGDVLEHLRDPWAQLERLVKLIKPGGKIIVSLLNIRYYKVIISLLFGDDWTYQDSGIMDLTHLRFFTRSTANEMITNAGMSNVICMPVLHMRRDKVFNAVFFGLLEGLFAFQWILTATK